MCDMVYEDGEWNWVELVDLFSNDILEHLAFCHLPKGVLGADLCLWKPLVDGKFSVKSAYKSLTVKDTVQDNKA